MIAIGRGRNCRSEGAVVVPGLNPQTAAMLRLLPHLPRLLVQQFAVQGAANATHKCELQSAWQVRLESA